MADHNTNVVLDTYEYDYKGDGGVSAKFSKCKKSDQVRDVDRVHRGLCRLQTVNLSENELSTMLAFTKNHKQQRCASALC